MTDQQASNQATPQYDMSAFGGTPVSQQGQQQQTSEANTSSASSNTTTQSAASNQQYDMSAFGGSTISSIVKDNSNPDISKDNSISQPAIKDAAVSFYNDPIGTLKAQAKGWYHGMDIYATTIGKALSGKDMKAAWQATYNEDTKQYNEDKDTNNHPFAAGIGNFLGQGTATFPLGAAAGKIVGALSATAEDISNPLIRGTYNTALNATSGATQGGIMGGLQTQQGQDPNQVWNQQSAKSGAILGGLLAPAQMAGNAKAEASTNYENFKNSLPSGTTVFGTDIPQNQGMWNSIKEGVTNKFLSKIPYLSDIPGIGVNAARGGQQEQITNGIANYVEGLAQKYPNGTLPVFQNAVKEGQQAGQNAIKETANTFRQVLQNNGITNHAMTETGPLAQELQGVTPPGVLKRSFMPILDQLQGKVPTSVLLGTKEVTGLKQQVWQEAQRLGKMAQNNTPADDAHDSLMNIYHSINRDINTSIQNVPNAQEAFHTFNTTTKAVSDTWDVKNSPEIAKAAQSLNNNYNAMNTFYNKMLNNKIAPQNLDKYNSMMTAAGPQAIKDQQTQNMVKNIYNSSMEKGKLNITEFFNKLNSAQVSDQIKQPVQEALQGLQFLANKTSAGLGHGLSKVDSGVAAAGAVGATHVGMIPKAPLVAATATATALGTINAHPPLMNFLRLLNKIPGAKNIRPDLSQYLFKKASDQLIKSGVILKQMEDGSTSFETRQDQ